MHQTFKDGQRHGTMTYVFADGVHVIGRYASDKPSGAPVYKRPEQPPQASKWVAGVDAFAVQAQTIRKVMDAAQPRKRRFSRFLSFIFSARCPYMCLTYR